MNYVTSIGIDVHAKTNSVCAIGVYEGTISEAKLPSDSASLLEWIRKEGIALPAKCVYESGPTGFGLARALNEADGIECVVAATPKLPYEKNRQKNDREDAEWLARQLIAGSVREVRVQTPEEESLRDLSRLRDEAVRDVTKAKQRVTSFLLAKGVRYTLTKKTWTVTFRKWAASYEFDTELDTYVFREKLAEVDHRESRLKAVEGKIAEIVNGNPELAEYVARFELIGGIGRVTSFAIVCEVVDFGRFPNGRAFASFVGLTPKESSSGERDSRGRITKAGNPRLRRLLTEAANQYAKPLRVPICTNPGIDPLVREHAEKCTRRLKSRRAYLRKRKKAANKSTVAVARELAEWIWHIAVM